MTDDIHDLVNKFLAWRLPKSVCSDLCVTNSKYEFPRSGTNLLTRDEARQMIEYLLGDLAMPTREDLAQVLCGAEGSPCACATRNYEDGVCCSDGSWAPGSPLTAADAVLRLLGGK